MIIKVKKNHSLAHNNDKASKSNSSAHINNANKSNKKQQVWTQ